MNDDNNNLPSTKKINILQTKDDKIGTDIAKMSDFFEISIVNSTNDIKENSVLSQSIEPIDLSIISEAIKGANTIVTDGINLVPDLEHLPKDIKEGLKSGRYIIGDSKQVDGNFRAVIVDIQNNNQRVKDITLKEVVNSTSVLDSISNIATQMQLRQITNQLKNIADIQVYQLEKSRDVAIKVPFLNARDYVLKAQTAKTNEDQVEYLKKAEEYMMSALNNVYVDMKTSSKHLALFQHFPILRSCFPNYLMNYLQEDLLLATKFTGFRISINSYLEDSNTMDNTFASFRSNIESLIETPLNKKGETAISLLHKNYNYNEQNLNMWYELPKKLEPLLKEKEINESSKTLLILADEV